MPIPHHTQLAAFFEQNLPAYLDLLRRMVAINSFTANAEGVKKLARLTAEAFAPLGFEAEFVPSARPDYGVHLALARPAQGTRQIAFISHLDTVYPPEDEEQNDFHWRVEGDRIYGPGVVDIKGGTVMILMILEALRTFAPRIFEGIAWRVLLNASEETMEKDFLQVCRRYLDGEVLACLVFEGGIVRQNTFKVIANRKGMAIFRITVEGKSAHAGSAHPMGANAIVQMAYLIRDIAGFTDYDKDITFNVGKIQGGTVTNRVPHFAETWVEMRAFDPDVFAAGIEKVKSLAHRSDVSSQDGYGCKVNVELVHVTDPWERNPGSERLLRLWQQAAADMGAQLTREIRGGLSDGNQLWKYFPTLDALGPSGGNAHSSQRSPDGSKDQEYVSIPSFVPKATLNTLAVIRLSGWKD